MAKLAYDLHLHSCLSPCGDDDMTPAMICGLAKVIGLDVIALTDHNSFANCPAMVQASKYYGITSICGMELTTAEEVHVLCYFHTLTDAMRFSDYVHDHILPIRNKTSIFGHQYAVDVNDNVIYEEETLLVSATDIPLGEVAGLMKEYNGIMVPAHINKTSTSIISNLGMIPEDSEFTCAEVTVGTDVEELAEEHPYLRSCNILTSSDAHTLNDIQEPIHFIEPEDTSIQSILECICGR